MREAARDGQLEQDTEYFGKGRGFRIGIQRKLKIRTADSARLLLHITIIARIVVCDTSRRHS